MSYEDDTLSKSQGIYGSFLVLHLFLSPLFTVVPGLPGQAAVDEGVPPVSRQGGGYG